MSFVNPDSIKILVVEDEITMQTILKRFLSNNYEVWICEDSLDALSFLQAGNIPDLIISDLNTPKLDGLGLITQLKASDFFNAIPVIVLSGEEQSEMRIKCLDAGADDYMIKPFNPRELEARLKAILRRIGK
jgi:DNA-binding response OmpR family regulator